MGGSTSRSWWATEKREQPPRIVAQAADDANQIQINDWAQDLLKTHQRAAAVNDAEFQPISMACFQESPDPSSPSNVQLENGWNPAYDPRFDNCVWSFAGLK
jgi:hypothetical protein